MKMNILGWEYSNIRKGMKDIRIEFSDNSKIFASTLFMMANGTGKTTTIKLLKAIFSNPSSQEIKEEWTYEHVLEFAPISFKADKGHFRVNVSFDDRIYYYWIQFNYSDGTVEFFTSDTSAGGKNPGLKFPRQIKQLFSKNFANRFIFDGEQAKKVLENKSNEAEEALLYLYRLNEIDNIIFEVEDIFRKHQEAQAHRETGSGNSSKIWMNRLDKAIKVYEEICSAEKILNNQKQELEHGMNAARRKIDEITSNDDSQKEQHLKLTTQLNQIKESIQNCVSRIIDLSRIPSNINANIFNRLTELGQSMQDLQLPKTISNQFFKDLAKQSECICGRPIGKTESDTILRKADSYLGGNELIVLNMIRGRLIECSCNQELANRIAELSDLCDKEHEIRQDIDALQDKVKGAEVIKDLRRVIEKAAGELALVNDRLAKIYSREGAQSKSYLKKDVESIRQNLNKVLGTLAFATQKDRLISYLRKIKNEALTKLKKEVIAKTNEKIERVIPDEKIEIEKIDNSLILKGKGGASEGQTLGIAYCYIGALFQDSELKLPFIVDSPAGSMDLDKRKEVAKIIPKIFEQLIMFVTSAEVQSFADQFYKLKDIQYITLETDENQICKQPNYDRAYFDNYQREHRDEKE